MFSLKIKYNVIFRAEKERQLDLKGSTGRPKKVKGELKEKLLKPFMIARNTVRED